MFYKRDVIYELPFKKYSAFCDVLKDVKNMQKALFQNREKKPR